MTRFIAKKTILAARCLGATTLATLALAACGATPPPPTPSAPLGKEQPPLTVASGPTVAEAHCVPTVNRGSAERERGVDALLAGKPLEANAIFEKVLAASPGDLAAETLRIASGSDLAAANARTTRDLESTPLQVLPGLPLAQVTIQPIPFGGKTSLHLEKASLAKNLITDDDAWLKKNGLVPMTKRPRAEDIPEFVADRLHGTSIQKLFVLPDHQIGIYGNVLGIFAQRKTPHAFDLSAITRTEGGVHLEVDFAQVVGNVLVLQLSHNGYSKEVHGKTGFLAAVSLEKGNLLWCSDPLVGNSQNFLVVGSHIITGYGFTAEPDSMFVVDVTTGKTESKEPLQSGPTWILRKGDDVFVRTYDTDMVYRLPQSAPPAPVAALGEELPATPATTDPETRCLVARALSEIDARDPDALERTVAALHARGAQDTLVKALGGAQSFLSQRKAHPGIDLGTRPVRVPEAPTWEYTFRGSTAPSPQKPGTGPRLVKLADAPADPVRTIRKPTAFDPSKPLFLAPVEKGRLPAGARSDIPSTFGIEDLRAVIPSGDRIILVYGGRYVVVVNGSTTEHILDFEAYRHPPKANPQWAEFAVEDVTYAAIVGTTLYVANGGGSYAREVFGKKGFMSAIDLPTGKLIWRSEPLVAGSTFGLTPDYIVVGYGFTDEPDFLFLIRRDDGRVATKARLTSAPHDVTVNGSRVHVESYSSAADFEIRP